MLRRKNNILIKNEEDIKYMRISCKLAKEVLEMIEPFVKEGITTDELNTICHKFITENQKATPSPLNYKGFPKSICTSVNHVICHGIPGKKKLKNGDIINIDVTVNKNGYHGDTSKMFIVGNTSVLAERLIKVTYECMWSGIKEVAPNKHFGDIGEAIQKIAHKNNFSVVEVFCGHGIGKEFHEEPQVLHYGKRGKGEKIKEGMIFTIEPMINAGKKGVSILKDNWTAVTKDRKLSAQWEHTILVTKDGFEVLTLREEEKKLNI